MKYVTTFSLVQPLLTTGPPKSHYQFVHGLFIQWDFLDNYLFIVTYIVKSSHVLIILHTLQLKKLAKQVLRENTIPCISI